MIDETFNLTPIDARRWDFGSSLRGYDRTRVDQFRDRAAEELERLTRVNQDLEAKARGFHEQLRAFRERDKALNDALITAQQLRNDIRESAEREAGLVVREAKADAERILDAARAEAARVQTEVDALERGRRVYMAQLRSLVERQLAELDAAAHHPVRGSLLTPERSLPAITHALGPVSAPATDPVSAPLGDAALAPAEQLENPATWAEGLTEA